MYCSAHLHQAYQSAWYKAYNSLQKRTLQNMLPAGKKEKQKKIPNCVRNPCRVFFLVPADIPVGWS